MADLHVETAEAAVYRRGELELAVLVTWGKTVFEEFDANMQAIDVESRDALIYDYAALRSAFGDPQPGDSITQDDVISEVMPIGTEPCFRYSSAYRHVLRIHTKIVSEA